MTEKMKAWQCSNCREITEDCYNQCQLITDWDVEPSECVNGLWKPDWKTIGFDELLVEDR